MDKSNILLVVMGYGGHARSVADVAFSAGYRQLVFVDSNARPQEQFINFPVFNTYPDQTRDCCLASGDNSRREQQMNQAIKKQWQIASIISPKSNLSLGASIGSGSFVGHLASIGPQATIGRGCIINTGAIVEHDCSVGDFSHISVNTVLAGYVSVGKFVFVGAGAVIRDRVSISDNVIIGAGSTVIKDIHEPGVYAGSPAKKIRSSQELPGSQLS